MEGIREQIMYIHFGLAGSDCGYSTSRDYLCSFAAADHPGTWAEMGQYIIHFKNADKAEIPLFSSSDLFGYELAGAVPLVPWKARDLSRPNADLAWAGNNPAVQSRGHSIRLFKRTWQNPNGPHEVTSIELISRLPAHHAPFVVAITVE